MISFCDFGFVERHFKFLKTVTGKGVFNLFLASMFLVGNAGSIWGYLMVGAFSAFGIFFILIGCACIGGYDDADIKKDDLKKQAKGSFSGKGTATENNDDENNSRLLDTA